MKNQLKSTIVRLVIPVWILFFSYGSAQTIQAEYRFNNDFKSDRGAIDSPLLSNHLFDGNPSTPMYKSNTLGIDGDVSYDDEGSDGSTIVDDRFWMTMITPGQIMVMNAVVYFEGGRDEYCEDDTLSFSPSDDIYTLIDDYHLVIQGRRPFTVEDRLQVGYKAWAAGYHYISIYQKEGVFENEFDIFLVDKVLNKTWNLSKEPYRFMTRSGEFNERFEIIYKHDDGSFGKESKLVVNKNQIDLIKSGGNIEIRSSIDKLNRIDVFDLNSKLIYSKTQLNTNEFKIPLSLLGNQMIFVNVETIKGERVSKKYINN